MSASKHKKNRKLEPNTPKTPRKQPSRLPWILGGVGAAVLVVLAVFFAVWNSGYFARHTTAVTVGSHSVTPAEYNFFQQNVYYNLQYFVDTSVPLSEQVYDEESGQTWADYLRQQTLETIASYYAIYDDAQANGFTLPQEDLDSIESDIANIALSAAANNYTLDGYLAAYYGPGCDEDSFRAYSTLVQTAAAYQNQYADSLTYDAAALDAYYAGHADALDTISYRAYDCGGDEALARSLKEAVSEDAFRQQAMSAAGADSDNSLHAYTARADLPADLSGWLTDPARRSGDTEVMESDGSWTAVMFLDDSRAYNDQPTVTVRHILLRADSETTAQDVLNEYLSGAQTEDAFAELAKTYSSDTTAADGGLLDGVYYGAMVYSFNSWCLDPARQSGDTAVVASDYGEHVIYFSSRGSDSNIHARVSDVMRGEDYTTWIGGFDGKLTAEAQSFGMRFTASH